MQGYYRVLQGSILGPILYVIYVNDLSASDTASKFIKFADDTTILTNGDSVEEAAQKMNAALMKVGICFQRNNLNLNPPKTRSWFLTVNVTGTIMSE